MEQEHNISALEKFLAEAPEENWNETPEKPDYEHEAERKCTGEVLQRNGWGSKYCQAIDLRGEEWLAAFEEAKKVIANGGFVALLGPRGPGKTQMAAEIARNGDYPEDGPGVNHRHGKTALYRRAMDIFLDLRHANKNHVQSSEKEVLDQLASVGLLVIDEFQERGESEWENRVIKNLIDKRYAAERPTIVIANMKRQDMFAALGESIVDRARENGKSIEFTWPSYRGQK